MAYEIHTTAEFDQWAARIKDKQAALCLASRLNRAANGKLGDVKSLLLVPKLLLGNPCFFKLQLALAWEAELQR